jgi:hypothetical protein
MKELGKHFLDPTTEIKTGTLGKNGQKKGWGDPIPGKHEHNYITGNHIFFADPENDNDSPKFHTGLKLNPGNKLEDYQKNSNIF